VDYAGGHRRDGLWLIVSILFKLYVANFTDYEGSYGTIGAELNAEIEHASPHGKAPGQKSAHGKLVIGARAARRFRRQHPRRGVVPKLARRTRA